MSDQTMRVLASLAAGLLFGLGLVLSGMSDPAKVLNFLDLAGTWDPSLAFVMAGAVAVTFAGYRLVLGRGRPLFDTALHLPTATKADPPLIAGSAVFGLGWGLAGFCPGPAFTAIALFAPGTLIFVPAMIAGMWAARLTPRLVLGKAA
jgi:uncharacterized protein